MLLATTAAFAQEEPSQIDSIFLGNPFRLQANANAAGSSDLFDRSPEVDIAKALYGQFSGLLVKQGTGRSEDNQSKLRLHGHSPLILVDGIPRELGELFILSFDSKFLCREDCKGICQVCGVNLNTTQCNCLGAK